MIPLWWAFWKCVGMPRCLRGQVGEAVRGRFVGHGEGVADILDGNFLGGFGFLQELHGGLLRQQQRGSEVVRSHALGEEIAVVAGRLVAKDIVAQGLQEHRAGVVVLPLALCQVNSAVLQIGHRTGGMRQITHMVKGESEVRGDVCDDVLAQRPGGVADLGQHLLRLGLVLREIVAPFAHHGAQFTVRTAGLFRGGRLLVHLPFELVLQPHLGLQHIDRQPRADADFGRLSDS